MSKWRALAELGVHRTPKIDDPWSNQRRREQNRSLQFHPLPKVTSGSSEQGPGANHEVLGLAADATGKIWMTRNDARSVTAYDPVADSFEEFRLPFDVVPRGIAILAPNSLVLQLWHSNEPSFNGNGNLNVGSAEFSPTNGDFRFHAGVFANNVATDTNGNIWVAEGVGLRHLSGKAEEALATHNLFTHPLVAVSAQDGAVWYTSSPDTLVRRVSGTDRFYQITPRDVGRSLAGPPSTSGRAVPAHAYVNPDVNSLVVDSHGNAWFTASGFSAIGEIKTNP